MGNGQYLSREVYLSDHSCLTKYTPRSTLHGCSKEHPGNQCHKQMQIVFINIRPQNGGEQKCIHQQLQQRIQKCPQKSQHRSFVSAPQISLYQSEYHLTIFIYFPKQFHVHYLVYYLSPMRFTCASSRSTDFSSPSFSLI